MADATSLPLWLMVLASASLALLGPHVAPPAPSPTSAIDLPWWQDVAAAYRLAEGAQATPPFPAEDCLTVEIRGQGAHRRVEYELTCPPRLLLASSRADSLGGQVTVLQALPPEFFIDPYELEQHEGVRAGNISTRTFGVLDLEEPAPACQATVMGVTLHNLTAHTRPHKHGGRAVYASFEVPFHVKYPAPVAGGEGCTRNVLQWQPGPTRVVHWLPPLLLVRLADAAGGHGGGDGPPQATDAGADTGLEGGTGAAPRVRQLEQRASQASAEQQQWSVLRSDRSAADAAVAAPAGCMLHVDVVSGVTVLAVLACSSILVLAALLGNEGVRAR